MVQCTMSLKFMNYKWNKVCLKQGGVANFGTRCSSNLTVIYSIHAVKHSAEASLHKGTIEHSLPSMRAIPKVSGLDILDNNIFCNLHISEKYIFYEL